MRRSLSAAAVAALLAVLMALTAWPAAAGGPTSVMITSPTTGQSAGLRYSDPAYDELQTQLRVTEGGRTTAAVAYAAAPGGRQVNVTWLVHDMSIHRIDQVFPDADGGPMILTDDRFAQDGSGMPVWHRPADGRKLVALLDRLGLLDTKSTVAGDGVNSTGGVLLSDRSPAGEAPEPAPAAPQSVSPKAVANASATTDGEGALTGWWWAGPGLAAGVLAALGGTRLRKQPEERQELLDV